MRDETVARNYAETLFELARRHEGLEVYGKGIAMVATLLDENARFRLFLETPRIDDEDKKAVVRKTFEDVLPKHLVNFVLVTIGKRRQRLLRDISRQYHDLVDAEMGREHIEVTVARPMDEATSGLVAQRFSAILGKQAVPHVRVKPEILGGIMVRTGDTIYDGSVRRHLEDMRRRLLKAKLPAGSRA